MTQIEHYSDLRIEVRSDFMKASAQRNTDALSIDEWESLFEHGAPTTLHTVHRLPAKAFELCVIR